VERIAGTLIGGILTMMMINNISNPFILTILLLVVIFFLLATVKVGYTLVITTLTMVIVITEKLEGISVVISGLERIVSTIIGVLIAFTVI